MSRPKGSFNPKRKGRLSLAEQSTIQGVAEGPLSVEKAAEKLAPALGRSEEALRKAIREARETFQSRAGHYEELLYESAKVAAKKGNHKPALDALDRLVGPKGERVIDPPSVSDEGNSRIQVVLFPIQHLKPAPPALEAHVIEADDSALRHSDVSSEQDSLTEHS